MFPTPRMCPMSNDDFRRKADALLQEAAQTSNMRDRSRLIDEAMRWHNMALDAHDPEDLAAADDSEPAETAFPSRV